MSWFTLRTIFGGSVIYTAVSWFTLQTIFSNLHYDSSMILLNLYGILIDTHFYPFFVVHGSPYEIFD